MSSMPTFIKKELVGLADDITSSADGYRKLVADSAVLKRREILLESLHALYYHVFTVIRDAEFKVIPYVGAKNNVAYHLEVLDDTHMFDYGACNSDVRHAGINLALTKALKEFNSPHSALIPRQMANSVRAEALSCLKRIFQKIFAKKPLVVDQRALAQTRRMIDKAKAKRKAAERQKVLRAFTTMMLKHELTLEEVTQSWNLAQVKGVHQS